MPYDRAHLAGLPFDLLIAATDDPVIVLGRHSDDEADSIVYVNPAFASTAVSIRKPLSANRPACSPRTTRRV